METKFIHRLRTLEKEIKAYELYLSETPNDFLAADEMRRLQEEHAAILDLMGHKE